MNYEFRFHIRLRGVAVEGKGSASADTPEEAEVQLRTALGSSVSSGILTVEPYDRSGEVVEPSRPEQLGELWDPAE